MYQIKTVGKTTVRNGYEIVVEGGRCEVRDRDGTVRYTGTYAACIAWLRERTLID